MSEQWLLERELRAAIQQQRAELNALSDEVKQLRAALWDLINRWSTEEGYDGAIQRARALLMDIELRHPISNRDG